MVGSDFQSAMATGRIVMTDVEEAVEAGDATMMNNQTADGNMTGTNSTS